MAENNSERIHWNASLHQYASHFPYIPLDENHLRHLVDLSMMKAFNASGNEHNDTHPSDECMRQPLFNIEFQATLHVMYWTIFIIAILGNGMVCFIVCQSSRMQTVTNYFIANLAIADMSMAFLCIPSSFISQSIQYWPFGSLLCRIVNFTQAVSVFVSAYTLVAISIDRYVAIIWPLRPRLSKRYAKLIIAMVWLVAFATAGPIPLVSALIQPDEWYQNCDNSNGWADIGYNFCVGDPGQIYEGRGFGRQGAHAPGFNARALGHCFFGEHTSVLPTSAALTNTQRFIDCARARNFLTANHWVSTHRADRQSNTACPGNALHNHVATWPRFHPNP